jgi:transcriptional regulator with XRE-family HTH domain
LINSDPMQRSRAQQTFIRRLNELLPRGEATIIARQTGIHLSTISNWRKGKGSINPSLEILEKLAKALNVPLGYLIIDEPLAALSASVRERLLAAVRNAAAMNDELVRQIEDLKK